VRGYGAGCANDRANGRWSAAVRGVTGVAWSQVLGDSRFAGLRWDAPCRAQALANLAGRMDCYRSLARPLLFKLDPERAHHLGIAALRYACPAPARALLRGLCSVHDSALRQRLWDLDFANPVGLAAGLDKDAVAIEPLLAMGFSHVEVGTITGQGQPGNDQPRLFRLVDDEAVINRMGFNNPGCTAVAQALGRRYHAVGQGRRRPSGVLGINIGKTKLVDLEQALDDYRASVASLAPYADYMVVNVSSPNTPGLRDLQAEASLRPLLAGVRETLDEVAPGRPLLLKIAPDLSEDGIDAAVDVALECGCNGLIATNTTITRSGLSCGQARLDEIGPGGLSGAPMRALSTKVLARVARRVDGRVPVIGVGGVASAEDAWDKICHGASLVQVYTAFIYHGPLLVRRINRGLLKLVHAHGLRNIAQAIGRNL
jgi:dihydroorotate dehydrogenase